MSFATEALRKLDVKLCTQTPGYKIPPLLTAGYQKGALLVCMNFALNIFLMIRSIYLLEKKSQ